MQVSRTLSPVLFWSVSLNRLKLLDCIRKRCDKVKIVSVMNLKHFEQIWKNVKFDVVDEEQF